MSANMVQPNAIDRLVAWARRRGTGGLLTRTIWSSVEDIPDDLLTAVVTDRGANGFGLDLGKVPPNTMGTILIQQNWTSVRSRYSERGRARYYGPDQGSEMGDLAPEDLPGPADQTRLWSYTFRDPGVVRPIDVVRDCDDLIYQSQEGADYGISVAAAITDAIRRDAIKVGLAAWSDDP